MRLLDEIAVLIGVYMLRILASGDFIIDSSTILVFICKNCVVLAEFQSIDGSARWQTSLTSAFPVLQTKKHFVRRQKATQIVLPSETDQ